MWLIVGVVLLSILLIRLEVPAMVKKKKNKELWLFSLMLLAGVTLTIAKVAQLPIPNPLDLITWVYRPASDMINHFLK
ncbi:hypothetical protein [Paenibacillus harenae]|uniref:Glucan phosphoethanolaminetransferase (Alkaline phosphatase superfamily) n=1 Tax=Paenibacillus harenae TaxID=306543 RepID=A0ABT9UAU9_PAEHA|nr:hypothetical protein [Paenibacillus harenae]MDQ0116138.1 glucan phosphoethanolaminetransferase (alkaline phosphatase superfamily) [Paenibacillus harenae]